MKYCPVCEARYDEEVIKFCTKDGTPLIEDEHPNFTALPSENSEEPDDEIGEATVIRRKPTAEEIAAAPSQRSDRIVIPTSVPKEQQVRQRTAAAYYPPLPQSNTAKTVVLTIIGTLFVLGCGAGLFWFLQRDKPSNSNTNTNANQNVNINSNVLFDSNFNFNTSSNFNSTVPNINTNLNANLKTPTPSPTPKPSPSITPTPTPSPSVSITPSRSPTPRPAGTPTPTPRIGPRPPTTTTKPPGNVH